MLSIIAVIGKNRELGEKNQLLWHVPGDLPRFKQLTMGHPILLGRKTYESIGRPLPGRTNIVISRHVSFTAQGVTVATSLDDAIDIAHASPGSEEIFVIGGGQIYAQAIDRADRLYLTIVVAGAPTADTYFPDYSRFKKMILDESHSEEGITFRYVTLEHSGVS